MTTSTSDAKHILTVYWVMSDPNNEEQMRELVEALEAQRDIPGVITVEHGPKTSQVDWGGPEKNFDYGMVLSFDNFDSARAYVPHPIHQKLVEVILRFGSEVSDVRGFWIDQ